MIRIARSTILLKFGRKSRLKKTWDPSLTLSLRRGPTEGLGLIEAGIKVFEHIDWNEQPAAATGQGIVGRLLIMGRF